MESSRRRLVRIAGGPSAFDGKKHSELYVLRARLAHSVGAVSNLLLSALEAAVVVEVKPHFVAVVGRNQIADFAGGT